MNPAGRFVNTVTRHRRLFPRALTEWCRPAGHWPGTTARTYRTSSFPTRTFLTNTSCASMSNSDPFDSFIDRMANIEKTPNRKRLGRDVSEKFAQQKLHDERRNGVVRYLTLHQMVRGLYGDRAAAQGGLLRHVGFIVEAARMADGNRGSRLSWITLFTPPEPDEPTAGFPPGRNRSRMSRRRAARTNSSPRYAAGLQVRHISPIGLELPKPNPEAIGQD